MAEEHSFDIVSKIDLQEVDNAIHQAMKEIRTRYDFKGSTSEIIREGDEMVLVSEDQYRLKSVSELLSQKLVKRGVPLKGLTYGSIQESRGGNVIQKIALQKGIPIEKGREIVRIIKDTKLRVQASIMGDQIRVKGKNKDDLQSVIHLLRESSLNIDMQFTNYR
ncbi:MAG: YajQ family cyclic di-GMP-binding protein [Acidobacteriota bacterium]